MATEIERKFLVTSDGWRDSVTRTLEITQGYLSSGGNCSVRVRRTDNEANLNIKSARAGIERAEFEFPIPADEAQSLLTLFCGDELIAKYRHLVLLGAHCWEIDEFQGANAGLVVAELELGSTDEFFERPIWLGEEVSHDIRYYNTELLKRPFSTWN